MGVSDQDVSERSAREAGRPDIGEDLVSAQSQPGIDQGRCGSSVQEITVAIERMAQRELLAAHKVDVIADSHD
jgi:hypothetical protein